MLHKLTQVKRSVESFVYVQFSSISWSYLFVPNPNKRPKDRINTHCASAQKDFFNAPESFRRPSPSSYSQKAFYFDCILSSKRSDKEIS